MSAEGQNEASSPADNMDPKISKHPVYPLEPRASFTPQYVYPVIRQRPAKEDYFLFRTIANSALAEYMGEKEKYNDCRKKNTKKGSSREEQTLSLLDRFKSKLTQAIIDAPEEDPVEEIEEDDDKGWLSHVLQFDEKSQKVKDANVQDEDTFEIYDPRNPVNKRRREESKKLLQQKKERR